MAKKKLLACLLPRRFGLNGYALDFNGRMVSEAVGFLATYVRD